MTFSEIALDEHATLHAVFARVPPEPDAGFPAARYECVKLTIRFDWQGRPKAQFPASKWKKYERELAGEEFAAVLDCYGDKLRDAMDEAEPVMDEDTGGRA